MFLRRRPWSRVKSPADPYQQSHPSGKLYSRPNNSGLKAAVAVENSVKYLVGMRLNAAKELYAAAFVPSTPGHEQDFKTFCDFLIAKGCVSIDLVHIILD